MKKRKAKPVKVVPVPVEHLTLIEETYKASTKAYRALKRWLKK